MWENFLVGEGLVMGEEEGPPQNSVTSLVPGEWLAITVNKLFVKVPCSGYDWCPPAVVWSHGTLGSTARLLWPHSGACTLAPVGYVVL